MKKIVALVLCLVMAVGLMAGCEKAMDVKTLTQKMDEAVQGQTAVSAKMDMDLEMSLGVTGMTMDMTAEMLMDMKVDLEKGAMFVGTDATIGVMGQSEVISMEVYAATEGDKMAVYTHEGTTDTWSKSEEADFAAQLAELQGAAVRYSDMPQDKLTLAKEKELVNEKECYVLTADMDGAYFSESMKTAMAAGLEELDQETKAMLEGIDWSMLSAKMVYYVDAETFRTVQMTGELLGMGELMNSMFAGIMGELLMGAEVGEIEMTIEVPVCSFSITEMTYDGVEVPAVPQEGIDAAAMNPDQGDGSCLLHLGEDTVRVVLPEGYTNYMAETDMLMAMSDDFMNSVTCVLVTDVTGEDLKLEVESEILFAQEEGYYQSHTDAAELNGYTTMSLIYNDGTAAYYAWKQLSSSVLFISLNTAGESDALEGLLANVELVAG